HPAVRPLAPRASGGTRARPRRRAFPIASLVPPSSAGRTSWQHTMALDELLDEHEQGERVRTWLKQNSLGLLGGLALGLALIWGGRWWIQDAHEKRVALGESYSSVVETLEAGDRDKAKQLSARLAGTAYAPLVALDLANAQGEAGEQAEAIASLLAGGREEPRLAAV